VSRSAKNIELITGVAAMVGTPALMAAGFAIFGTFSAVQFRIYDITMDYASGVAAAFGLLALIFLWPIPAAHRRVLILLWLARTGVTLGLMLAYEALYGLDASDYFLSGKSLSDPFSTLEFGQGTQNIQGLVGLLSYITDSYNAMKVIFSYVGLIAVYILYRAAVICLGGERIILLYLLGLLPSLLFWTSILGKDPIVLLGIAIYCYGVAGLIVRNKMSMLVFVVIGLAIAAFIRVWLGLIFVIPLIAAYVLAGRSSAFTKIIFIMIAVPGFLITLQLFSDRFSVETTQDLVHTTERISTSWSHGGSALEIEGSFDSIGSMIAFAPIGAFTALFRPLPFEVPNAFGTMAGLENAFILSLFAIGFGRRGIGWVRQPVLLWAVSLLLVWGTVYGFASYQNLGTAFRFRAQVAPILLLLGLYLTYGHLLNPAKDLRLRFWPIPPSRHKAAAPDPSGSERPADDSRPSGSG
jgi:hypothetical protein